MATRIDRSNSLAFADDDEVPIDDDDADDPETVQEYSDFKKWLDETSAPAAVAAPAEPAPKPDPPMPTCKCNKSPCTST